MGLGEAGDPVGRGREQHPVSVPGGGDSQGGGQVCLTGAGRAEQDDVAGLGQEAARGQGSDLLTCRWLGIEVEVLEGLDCRKPGRADP